MRVVNPIRAIVDDLKVPENNPLPLIDLSIGDPTRYGNMSIDNEVKKAVVRSLESNKNNGYTHSEGQLVAKTAIAKYMSDIREVKPEDVIITSGASGALEICIESLCNPGDELLVPQPGFSLYKTISDNKGIKVTYYPLDAFQDWEIKLTELEGLIGPTTKAILLTNPSNPCGSVFSKAHLEAIIAVAKKYQLPIIADEIYRHMVFEGVENPSIADLTDEVPLLVVGGMAKRFVVPGWRIGWIVVYDNRDGSFVDVRKGLRNLSQLILGSNTLIQGAIPDILTLVNPTYFTSIMEQIESHVKLIVETLQPHPYFHIIEPKGAMYIMVGIKPESFEGICDDVQFAKLFLHEEKVVVLPGSIFGIKNYIRIVTSAPAEQLLPAMERMVAFCARHARKK